MICFAHDISDNRLCWQHLRKTGDFPRKTGRRLSRNQGIDREGQEDLDNFSKSKKEGKRKGGMRGWGGRSVFGVGLLLGGRGWRGWEGWGGAAGGPLVSFPKVRSPLFPPCFSLLFFFGEIIQVPDPSRRLPGSCLIASPIFVENLPVSAISKCCFLPKLFGMALPKTVDNGDRGQLWLGREPPLDQRHVLRAVVIMSGGLNAPAPVAPAA